MTDAQCLEHARKLETMAIDVATIKGDVKHLSLRINGSMDRIADHVEAGAWWRGAVLGIATTVILSIIAASLAYGEMKNQVDVNTQRWDRLFKKMGDQMDILTNDK